MVFGASFQIQIKRVEVNKLKRRHIVSDEQPSPDLLSSSNLPLKSPKCTKIITADVVKCMKFMICEIEDTRLSDPPYLRLL